MHITDLSGCVGVMQAKGMEVTKKPVVAWISHFVFAPDEYFQISFAPYKLQYAQVGLPFLYSSYVLWPM